MQNTKQSTWTGITAIVAGLLAFASLGATMAAVKFNAEALANPMLILNLPGVSTSLTKWSMLLDMLGYYLLLLPLIFLLRRQLGPDNPLLKLGSFCGLAYVLIGATGAAILSVVWPYIIAAYKTADPQMRTVLAAQFRAFNLMVYEGMWNLLEMLFAGAWWMILGLLLYRKGSSVLSVLTCLLGLSCLGNAAAVMLEAKTLHEASLNIYLLLSIVWTVIMGIRALRQRPLIAQSRLQADEKRQAKQPAFSNS